MISAVCIAAAVVAVILGFKSEMSAPEGSLHNDSMGMSIFLVIGSIIYLILSALTAYVSFVKNPTGDCMMSYIVRI